MEDYIIHDRKAQIRLVLIVAASIFMFSLDYSMVNISLPSIAKYFHVMIGAVAWLPLVYLLIVTSTLLGFGKLGDMKGHRTVFAAGLGFFLTGTLLCSVAPRVEALIGFRAVQSLGEAMFSPVGIAIVTTFLPSDRKGRALGVVALAQGLGLMLGNVAGGYINTHFVWRGIFLVNVPLCLITIAAALRFLPVEQPRNTDKKFDFAGAAMVFVLLSTLIYSLNLLGKKSVDAALVTGLLAVSLAALVLFVMREAKVRYPLLDLRLFGRKGFAMANLSAFFLVSMLIGTSFIAPFLMEVVRGLPVMATGVFLMLPSLMMLILAPFAGRLADAVGSRVLCSVGAALEALAFVMCSYVNKDSSFLFMAGCMILLGAGAGLFLAPNNRLVMMHAPQGKQGVASGVYKICVSTGSVLGIAALPIMIMHKVRAGAIVNHVALADVRRYPELIAPGFRAAFIFAACVSIIAFVFAVLAEDKPVTPDETLPPL